MARGKFDPARLVIRHSSSGVRSSRGEQSQTDADPEPVYLALTLEWLKTHIQGRPETVLLGTHPSWPCGLDVEGFRLFNIAILVS